MESSASKCNRALPSAIEPICFGAQLRERYTLKSDIYQLSVLIAGVLLGAQKRLFLLDPDLLIGTVEKSRVQAFHFCKNL